MVCPVPECMQLLKPNLAVHRLSAILLCSIFVLYAGFWVNANRRGLFDPQLQHDDARQLLFFYHQFDSGSPLKDDPVAAELWLYNPPFFRLLYRVLVPFTGVLVTAKIVQGLCYLIVAMAVLLLIRSPRAGLAAGLIAGFLILHTEPTMGKIPGGLPKGFAYPVLMLWLAGALTSNWPARAVAALIGAATYPAAMLLVLASETSYELSGALRAPMKRLKNGVIRLVLLGFTCVLIIIPFTISKSPAGSLPTYAEAEQNPVFREGGRIELVPLRNPLRELGSAAISPYRYASNGPVVSSVIAGRLTPVFIFLVFFILILTRVSPIPYVATAVGCASVVMFFLARFFAFKLYLPEKYALFGLVTAALALAISTIGLVGHRFGHPSTAALRNGAAALFIIGMCTLTGTGLRGDYNFDIDGRDHANLYRFASLLPVNARFAAHPRDASDLPLFAARATTISYETLNPWLDKSYESLRVRAVDTLFALYATNRQEALDFCRKYQVTHLLLRRGRYRRSFRWRARFVEPFSTMLLEHLEKTRLEELVLRDPPAKTIVFRSRRFIVVNVELLVRAWSE